MGYVGYVVLLNGYASRRQASSTPGADVARPRSSGDPHAAAIAEAVRADYCRVTDRPPVTVAQLLDLAGQQVSLLWIGTNLATAAGILASQGSIFRIFRGSRLGLRPKGTRRGGFGYCISAATTLDVEPGYAAMAEFPKRVAAVRASLPQVVELTQERLEQLPARGHDCTLAVFGTCRLSSTTTAVGAIWLLHSYLPHADIAQGVLLVRPEYAVGQHTNVSGNQLLQAAGAIADAPVVSRREALQLTHADYDVVLARVARTRR